MTSPALKIILRNAATQWVLLLFRTPVTSSIVPTCDDSLCCSHVHERVVTYWPFVRREHQVLKPSNFLQLLLDFCTQGIVFSGEITITKSIPHGSQHKSSLKFIHPRDTFCFPFVQDSHRTLNFLCSFASCSAPLTLYISHCVTPRAHSIRQGLPFLALQMPSLVRDPIERKYFITEGFCRGFVQWNHESGPTKQSAKASLLQPSLKQARKSLALPSVSNSTPRKTDASIRVLIYLITCKWIHFPAPFLRCWVSLLSGTSQKESLW